MKPALPFVCLAILSVGCATPTAKVSRARDFDVARLAQEGLILAGVTALGGGEYQVADTVSQQFEQALRERRPGVRFSGLPETRQLLGDESIRVFEKRFSDENELPREMLAALRRKPDAPAFLAWINLEQSTSDSDVEHGREVTYRVLTDPATGRSIVVEDTVFYVTTSRAGRRVSARFAVYEIATGREVWSARMSHFDRNANSRRSIGRYPLPVEVEPPGTFEVLAPIIDRAVKLLLRD